MDILACLIGQLAALQIRNAELEQLAYTDTLTGCSNRRSYDQRIQQLQGTETFIYIDLCKLGLINNTLGHSVADGVLARIGTCLRATTDHAYRTGGDEFVIVLNATPDDATQIMRRVEAQLQGYRVGTIPVMLAWGVGRDVESAEEAMYRHKDTCRTVFEAAG